MLMVIINNVKCAKGQKGHYVLMSEGPLKDRSTQEYILFRACFLKNVSLMKNKWNKKVRVLVFPFLWRNEQINDISDFYTLFNKIDITNMAC